MKRLLLVLGFSFAWSYPGIQAAPASSAGASSQAPRNSVLAKIFRKGVDLYEKKRFSEAVEAFRLVLGKQNDHTPSRVYLARALYQQKNVVEALKVFRELDVKALEPDAAYDYGQAAYRSGDYENAIKAFGAVPNGHPLFDLAGYYGGISAYKIAEFQRAIDLFDQAVVLPSKLVRSQKLYRLEAEKKLFLKQKAEVESTGIPNFKGKREAPTIPFVYDPQEGLSLTHSFTHQTVDTKKGQSEEADIQRSTLGLYWGSDKPPSGVRSQWLYLADLRLGSSKDAYKEVKLIANPTDVLEDATLERYQPDTVIRPEVAGGYEMALGNQSTLGLVGGAIAYVGDGDFAEKSMYAPYASIFFSQKTDAIESKLSVASYPMFDSEELKITHTVQDGIMQINFTKSFFAALKGQLNEYSYNVERVNGADWNGRGQLEIGYRREKGVSIKLGTFYEVAQGYRLYDVAQELPLTKFNLNQFGGYTSADLNITNWWMFGFAGKFAQNTFANVLPAQGDQFPLGGQEYLDEYYGEKISQFSVYTTFYKNF